MKYGRILIKDQAEKKQQESVLEEQIPISPSISGPSPIIPTRAPATMKAASGDATSMVARARGEGVAVVFPSTRSMPLTPATRRFSRDAVWGGSMTQGVRDWTWRTGPGGGSQGHNPQDPSPNWPQGKVHAHLQNFAFPEGGRPCPPMCHATEGEGQRARKGGLPWVCACSLLFQPLEHY